MPYTPPTVVKITRKDGQQTIDAVLVYDNPSHVGLLGIDKNGKSYSPLNVHIHKDDLPALIRALQGTLVGPLGMLALDAEGDTSHGSTGL
jgi:hypothetical protein